MSQWKFYSANEIKPAGWLKRQLHIQAEGLSGHLDLVWPDIRDSAWVGGDRESWERAPYWLDGFIPLAYLLEDQGLIARAQKYVDAIIARQQPDGWICPCEPDQRKDYDTWAVFLIAKTLTVYYQCSRDERAPKVIYDTLYNFYQQLKSGALHLFEWGEFRWFEGFIAINFLYERQPEPWLKEMAGILREQGANYRDFMERWKRPLNAWTLPTHIVNLAMMLKFEAVSCDLFGEPYRDQAEEFRALLAEYNGTPVESFTGDECLSGLSPIQGTELCAIVEMMYSYELLYAYTGDPKWVQRLEVLAFNALPATLSDDMWAHQYVQMSNQIACQKFPGRSLFRSNGSEAHLFGLEPNFGCCTANFSQGWPKLALSAFLHQGNTVLSAVPAPSELHADGVDIWLETDYPFKTHFTYTIRAGRDFRFQVRVPDFARNLTVDGHPAQGGMLAFDITAGEREITIDYQAEPRFVERPHGLCSVQWGPLVFSVPVDYEKAPKEYARDGVERKFPYCDYEYLPKSPWNFGYAGQKLTVEQREVGETPFSSEAPPVVVRAQVVPIDWGLQDGYETVCAKTPESRTPKGDCQEMALYPYGCAKLRMTELPQTAG